jgi:hypothetical protein
LIGLAIVGLLVGVGLWGRTYQPHPAVFAIEHRNEKRYRYSRDSIDVSYKLWVKNIGESSGRVDCWAYFNGEKLNSSHVSRQIRPGSRIRVRGRFSLPRNTPNRVLDDIEPGCDENSRQPSG